MSQRRRAQVKVNHKGCALKQVGKHFAHGRCELWLSLEDTRQRTVQVETNCSAVVLVHTAEPKDKLIKRLHAQMGTVQRELLQCGASFLRGPPAQQAKHLRPLWAQQLASGPWQLLKSPELGS